MRNRCPQTRRVPVKIRSAGKHEILEADPPNILPKTKIDHAKPCKMCIKLMLINEKGFFLEGGGFPSDGLSVFEVQCANSPRVTAGKQAFSGNGFC